MKPSRITAERINWLPISITSEWRIQADCLLGRRLFLQFSNHRGPHFPVCKVFGVEGKLLIPLGRFRIVEFFDLAFDQCADVFVTPAHEEIHHGTLASCRVSPGRLERYRYPSVLFSGESC